MRIAELFLRVAPPWTRSPSAAGGTWRVGGAIRRARRARGGLALVEVLLAVVIAALVAAVAFALYDGIRRSISRSAATREASAAAAAAMERLGRDLACMVPLADAGQSPPYMLTSETRDEVWTLQFCTAVIPAGAEGLDKSVVEEVAYRLVRTNTFPGAHSLIRVGRLLASGGEAPGPVREEVARGISEWRVLMLAGKNWVAVWPPGTTLPLAARVDISVRRGDAQAGLRSEFVIPVGHAFTPRPGGGDADDSGAHGDERHSPVHP